MSAVVFVPSFFAAGVAVEEVRSAQREAALRALRETVRANSLMIDGQIERSLGALTALAQSPSIAARDFKAFYGEAKAVDQRPDVWTILLDSAGRQLVNTSVPFGAALPTSTLAAPRVVNALATGKPLASDLFVGAASGKLLTTFYFPVPTSSPEGRRYVLAQAFSVDYWRSRTFEPTRDPTWVAAVLDSTGRFISRSRSANELLGKPARPELADAAARSTAGMIRHKTLEGTDSYDAFGHSSLTGWTVAVAAPVASIEASATQAVALLALGLFSALSFALFGAALVGGRLIRGLEAAATSARALARREPIAAPPTSIRELRSLGDAFTDAAAVLAEESRALAAAQADRDRLLANEIEARERAQAESAAKDKFVAMLGHELRNPLAAIAGAVEILHRNVGSPDQRDRWLKVVLRQNRHLAGLVDGLLETSRMLSGKIQLRNIAMDLAVCVGECVEALRLTEAAAGHPITFEAQEAWIDGDAARIEQIVSNLIGNALKFSPAGYPVHVRVSAFGANATLAIADLGPGIPEHLAELVFEPFVQGPPPGGGLSAGLGIGLALARQLVELHGGRISVGPTSGGRGATLTVSLPLIPTGQASPRT